MAPFLHRHRLEIPLYVLAGVFGVLGAASYIGSYFSRDWSVKYPVLPFFLVVLAGSFTLTAVTLSLVRLFHQDHYPEDRAEAEDREDTPGGPRTGSTPVRRPR